MSIPSSVVIATGPARGLVGGVTRHLQLLEQIAARLSIDLTHFEIGRRHGESGAGAQLWRLITDYREFARVLKTAGRSGRPVVAHVNSSIRPVCVARDAGFVLIARLLRVPVIYQVHGCLLQGPDDGRTWLRRSARRVLGLADRVVVLSRAQSRAIGGTAAQRAIPVNNAVQMMPRVYRSPATARPLHILFLSRLVPEKGVMLCLEAMQRLKAQGVAAQLSMAGSGPMLDKLPDQIREMGLADCVRVLGFVSPAQTRQCLLTHDLMWLPSLIPEGQPYALLEALEVGMPVVVTRAGAVLGEMIDEAARHGSPLLEIGPTAEALAEATAALTADPHSFQRLQLAARELAETAYSMESVLPQWRHVWQVGT